MKRTVHHYHLAAILSLVLVVSAGCYLYLQQGSLSSASQGITKGVMSFKTEPNGVAKLNLSSPPAGVNSAAAAGSNVGLELAL